MKRFLAIVVLAVGVCVFVSSARAESNPLLTIFEAIKTGENGTLAINVEKAIDAYNKHGAKMGPITSLPNLTEREGVVWWWKWAGNSLKDYAFSPIAYLSITLAYPRNPDGSFKHNLNEVEHYPILSAKYEYEFVGFRFSNELTK